MPPVTSVQSLPPRTVDASRDASEEKHQPERRPRSKNGNPDQNNDDKAANHLLDSQTQEVVAVSQPIDSMTLVQLLPPMQVSKTGARQYLRRMRKNDSVKVPSPTPKLNKAV